MNDNHSVKLEGSVVTAILERRDRPWGHAIDVSLVDADGLIRGNMVFACHPEFRRFYEFQAMSTEDLVDIVRQRLVAAIAESASGFDHGITTLFRFNSPSEEWDADAAGLPPK
jgi:hypothetical protein